MLAFLLLPIALVLHQTLAQINPDANGFNMYKDSWRAKPNEGNAIFDHGENPAVYFYRSPSWLVFPSTDSPYNKRGVNHFKSFMLSPQREDDLAQGLETQKEEEGIYHFPRVVVKRSVDPMQPVRVSSPCAWINTKNAK